MGNLLRLPVEVIAYIQSLLDLASLIATSTTCRLLRAVASDPLLNPWRAPILRALNQYQCEYPPELRNLSVYSTVPRHNWIEILALARSDFLLLEATLPNLEERDWEEAFKRRFLPSWKKWKDGGRWKAVFFKLLWRISHRLSTTCTTNEAWSNYIILNRTGSVNSCFTSSRSFDPVAIFNEMKIQKNLTHLETHARLLVRFTDVRIIAFGTLHKRNSLFVNPNARMLLHPTGVEHPQDVDSYPNEILEEEDIEVDSPSSPFPPPLPLSSSPAASPIASSRQSPHNKFASLFRSRSRETDAQPSIPSTSSFFRSRSRDSGPGPSSSRNILQRIPFVGTGASKTGSSPIQSTDPLPPSVLVPTTPIMQPPPAPSQSSSPLSPRALKTQRFLPPPLNVPSGPYAILRHPTPHQTHRNYPNYTVHGQDWRWFGSSLLEEDGNVWVGPMLLAAQLVSSTVDESLMPDAFEADMLTIPVSGKWASFGWEDLWACAPWMKDTVDRRVDGLGLGLETT